MQKKTYTPTTLACIMQQDSEITSDKCLNGIISKTTDGFRFEEVLRKGRPPRNPKLFDGQYISMVRMQNGKYQIHMKTLADGFDREKLPYLVCNEMVNALKILD